ncbi:MAG TPA: twin-arginine translocase TatA/TatE family subunit [Actinomycetota bacterium]|jgi:sec-independent protein translocase protein TatA
MIGMIGPETIVILVIVVLIVFGAARLPQIARSVGQAKGEFEKGLKEGGKGDKDAADSDKTEAKKTSDDSGSPGS